MEDRNQAKSHKLNAPIASEEPKSTMRQVVDTIVYFIIVLVAVLLIQRFIVQPVEVDGASMESTLHSEDHLLLEKLSYRFSDPKRFDVIVFQPYRTKDDVYYIKRVIGLPGETVQIVDNIIYINGEPLIENYGKENVIRDPKSAREPIQLGEDEYFVLGDNRNHSSDSRDKDIGVVNRKFILGKAWLRIWPLSDIGFIKH